MKNITTSMIKELREITGAGIIECKKSLIKANGDIKLAIDNIHKFSQVKAIKKLIKNTTEGIILIKISNNNKSGAIIELNCETDFTSKNKNFELFGNKVLDIILEEKISNVNILKNRLREEILTLISRFNENINISRMKLVYGNQIGFYLHGRRIGAMVSVDTINANKDIIKKIAMHIVAKKPEYLSCKDIPNNILEKEYEIQFDIAIKSGKTYEVAKKIAAGKINKFKEENSLMNQPYIIDQSKTVSKILSENSIKINSFVYFELGEITKYKFN